MTAQIIKFRRPIAPIRQYSERTELNVILIAAIVANTITWVALGMMIYGMFFA